MSNFIELLAEYSHNFNQQLPTYFPLPSGPEKRVVEAMYYSVSNGGKRLRPFLVQTTASLFGVPFNISLPVAVSLECLHNYSLIHDDLPAMDNDTLRRGKPTCHIQFDEATAILAGDGLLTYAFEILSQDDSPLSPLKQRELICLLANAAGAFNGMVAGQMLDLYREGNSIATAQKENLIKQIEEMKTGRLLRYACEAGAVLGHATPKQRQSLIDYSRKIGVAFQIADDVLDVEGSQELVGKTLKKDEAQNKLTFISIYGLDGAKKMAQELIAQAKESLKELDLKTQTLQELADFIISRQS